MTVTQVIKEHLIEIGEDSLHKLARMTRMALSGVRLLHTDVSGVPKMQELEISSGFTVNLPTDFLTHLVISLKDTSGRHRAISRNDNMSLGVEKDSCGDVVRSGYSAQSSYFSTDKVYRNGEFLGKFFGAGGGTSQYGQYRIDYANNRIILENLAVDIDKLYLEYLSDLSVIDADYKIHPYDIEALKAYLNYKDVQRKRSISLSEKEYFRGLWNKERNAARRRHQSFTNEEWLEVVRRFNQKTPKF